ncbi:MAG TPA: hypothetical protein VG675_18005 [Bryobacteraceae bacterium]|nr:hypothetical protein [Bryobacteraceae bacterium]
MASVVWGRKHVMLRTCPKSFITADSLAFVEEFFVRRRLGGFNAEELSGRQADAFVILETEFAAESNNGQQHTRHS